MGQTGAETDKLVRILMLYQIVKTRPDTPPARLQEELGVSSSTLARDRQILRQLGVDIIYHKKAGCHEVRSDTFLMAANLTLDERLAIILAVTQLGTMRESFIARQARNAAAKLLAVQDPAISTACHHLLGQSRGALCDPQRTVEDTLFRAVTSRRRIAGTYAKPGDASDQFEMDPYQLFMHDGALYVEGWHWSRHGVRCLKVCRITEVAMTAMSFSNMRGYDFARHRQHAFGVFATGKEPQTARLWFSPVAAPYIREERRAGQHITEHDDGSLDYEIIADEPREVLWWAMRWGGEFEVKEPGWLREEAMEKVRKMAGRYGMRVEG